MKLIIALSLFLSSAVYAWNCEKNQVQINSAEVVEVARASENACLLKLGRIDAQYDTACGYWSFDALIVKDLDVCGAFDLEVQKNGKSEVSGYAHKESSSDKYPVLELN